MRPDPDAIEASLPGDHAVALLASEVRRLQAVIASENDHIPDVGQMVPTPDDSADWLRRAYADRS